MKLLDRTALNQLLLALPLVLFGTAIGYFAVRHAVNDELDEQLEHHAELLKERIGKGEQLLVDPAPDQFMHVEQSASTAIVFQDTILYNVAEKEEISWRMVGMPIVQADGRSATLLLGRATVGYEDLIVALASVIAGVLLLLFLGNMLLSRWLDRRLWAPFHGTLDAMQRFRLEGGAEEALPSTHITEFQARNDRVGHMMTKLRKDYSTQKRFSEQAAHELQTPLAIMQGKLDELIQMPALGKMEADMIEVLYRARERMGRTVSNMLLLARIGNQEFTAVEVDWAALFHDQRTALAELIEKYALHFTIHKEHHCHIRLHPVLAELIAANLLRNAVQHNHHGGHVNVWIGEYALEVTNSGAVLAVEPDSLFDRFAKGDPSSSGSGLGLSMVKEICDNAGLDLIYSEVAGVHTVVVRAR